MELHLKVAPDFYRHGLEAVEQEMIARIFTGEMPEVHCPVHHAFAPGVYLRTIKMPAGSIVLGAEHKTEHFNIVHRGRAEVMIDGIIEEIDAPFVFVSKPGIRKVLYIKEDMEWSTVHATDLTDPEEIERQITVKTDTIKNREAA